MRSLVELGARLCEARASEQAGGAADRELAPRARLPGEVQSRRVGIALVGVDRRRDAAITTLELLVAVVHGVVADAVAVVEPQLPLAPVVGEGEVGALPKVLPVGGAVGGREEEAFALGGLEDDVDDASRTIGTEARIGAGGALDTGDLGGGEGAKVGRTLLALQHQLPPIDVEGRPADRRQRDLALVADRDAGGVLQDVQCAA